MNDLMRTVHLGNWREAPHNRWAFHHVRELLTTANIPHNSSTVSKLSRKHVDLTGWKFTYNESHTMTLNEVLENSWTDALLILHKGSIIFDWFAPHYSGIEPHILFSVSKSVTGALVGVLVDNGQLDPDESVLTYLPEAAGSAFEDSTVRNVLDMQVGLDFEEVYTGTNEQFNHYRAATGWNPVLPGETASDLRTFLTSIKHGDTPHGEIFQYMSPNTDMLGLILEAASGTTLPKLLSQHIWSAMGAESDAYITVDRCRTPRAAGGICVRLPDLARLGQVMCDEGQVGGKQIIPLDWIEDTMTKGDSEAWRQGSFSQLIPQGRYRNQWYQIGNPNGAICAIGIHGQWIYIDPSNNVVIVKLSSQPDPVDDNIDKMLLKFYDEISNALK